MSFHTQQISSISSFQICDFNYIVSSYESFTLWVSIKPKLYVSIHFFFNSSFGFVSSKPTKIDTVYLFHVVFIKVRTTITA